MSKTTPPARSAPGDEARRLERRVLVLAPFGRDAAEICRVLAEADIEALRCEDADALCREVARGAAAALLAEEALGDAARTRLNGTLAGQPEWSDFPVLVMSGRSRKKGDAWRAVQGVEGTGYLSLLERPFHVATLVSAVRTAMHARARQYQVRDELGARARAEAALRALNETLEARVEEQTEEVRTLASALTVAEQQERRRISQVLHDDLQQLLYGVRMRMAMVGEDLREAGQPDLGEALDEARALMDRAVATTRQLALDLAPPILQDEGLVEALRGLRRQMEELHGLEVAVEAEHPFYVEDEDLRVLLFQIVRELLFNVKKHAGVDRAHVRLQEEAGTLAIHVIDEGKGFDGAAAAERGAGGLGLYSVRERLRLLGGRMEVRSRPGGGTHVVVYAPFRSRRASA